jgi:protein-disulfide isomerase
MATRILSLVLFVLAVVASSAFTALYLEKKGGAGGANKEEIGKIVASFIEENPEVIIQGLQKAQMKREMEEAKKAEENISSLRDSLEKNPKDPHAGNKDGDVTMVIFHDFNCGYCRKSVADVKKLVENDSKLRIVMKDLPILGPLSEEKAKISIAVSKIAPEKWYEYYITMADKTPQNADQILEIVAGLGINSEAVKAEMTSKEIQEHINDNKSIADQIGIRGTPAFVINGKLVKGAVGYDSFKEMVEAARS